MISLRYRRPHFGELSEVEDLAVKMIQPEQFEG